MAISFVSCTRRRRPGRLLGFAVALAVALPACDALPEITAFRDQAAAARDDIAVEVDRLEAVQTTAPDDPVAQDALDRARARHAALGDAVQRLDVLLAEAESPSDSLSGAAHALSPLLPEPFRLPVLLAAGLGVSLWRAQQLKRSAASIVTSVDEALRRDPSLKERFAQHADLFRAVQTPTAHRIVDEVTKKDRTMVRLPV